MPDATLSRALTRLKGCLNALPNQRGALAGWEGLESVRRWARDSLPRSRLEVSRVWTQKLQSHLQGKALSLLQEQGFCLLT